MRVGSKKIFHLEAWVVKVMALYKVRLLSAARLPTHCVFYQHYLMGFDMGAFE
jgi:hypothetical protein